MKRFIAAALCVLCLTACGGQSQQPAAYQTGDLDELVQAGAFSEELETLDGDMAFMLYALSEYELERDALQDCAVLRSSGATCEEGAVLLFADEAAAQKAEQALGDYLAAQIRANEDYRPGEIPKLEEALLQRRGSTLLLVVAADMDAVTQTLEN